METGCFQLGNPPVITKVFSDMKKPKATAGKIADLIPDDRNANTGTVRGSSVLEHSLRTYGAGRSILVDKNNRIIAGNKTIEAAGSIGLDGQTVVVETDGSSVVVVRRTDIDLDSPEGRGLAIADNRAGELNLEWSEDVLAELAEEIDLTPFFFDDELDFSGIEEPVEGLTDEDDVPELVESPVSERGDIWILGNHRVMCGDSTDAGDVALLMDGELADALITDPPYGVSYADKNEFLNAYDKGNRVQREITNDHLGVENIGPFWKSVFSLMFEHTKKGGSYYIAYAFREDLAIEIMTAIRDSGWLLKHELVWVKNNHVLGRCDYNYKHEPILYGWKPGAGHYFGGSGSDTSVWDFDKPLSSKLHPTMKPVELIAHAAERALKPGEIVLDPFLGSGSTLIAAEKTNRKCYGMEISPAYVDVIIKRWQDFTGKQAIHDNGKTFQEVSDSRA